MSKERFLLGLGTPDSCQRCGLLTPATLVSGWMLHEPTGELVCLCETCHEDLCAMKDSVLRWLSAKTLISPDRVSELLNNLSADMGTKLRLRQIA